jgi:hypothetical protein
MIFKKQLVQSFTSYKLLYPLYYIVVIDSIIALSINFINVKLSFGVGELEYCTF